MYQLLTQLDTQHQLWNREQQLLAQGEETRSREYAQIYTIVMQLLEKYNLLLGEEPLQIRDFTEVLEAGLSAADVAVIPPGYDSVTIGDIERTRLNHIRILFFIGVNDGVIPKAANAGGIISVIKSTRGNIYDRNGEELATNVLAYSVTFEDNGTYDSTREKNLTLNGIAYKVLKILESNGDSISTGFHIVLDESGNYAFDVDEGFTLNRFRADIYEIIV